MDQERPSGRVNHILANPEVVTKIVRRRDVLARKLLAWSKVNSPSYPWRLTADAYHIMVAEMLLRRTRATNASRVYNRFLAKFPTVRTLSAASEEEIGDVIRPAGMVRRSRAFKSAAVLIVTNHGGIFPQEEKDLLNVLGKGSRYTANAIRCFAFGLRTPIFDVNVKRIFERVFSIDFGRDSHKRQSSWETVSAAVPIKNARKYNLALLDLGILVCIPANPHCEICPLEDICDFPKRVKKRAGP